MTKEECFNAPKYAGIYYFKNKVNGKYYIGQSVKLRKRLLDHYSHYITGRYDHLPIYKAFKKYGIENFELGILDTIRDALSKKTKAILDELEIKYIKEYNSYGKTGYNQTRGGDAGVLGLKHTNETKEKLKCITLERTRNEEVGQEHWIKAKNVETGEVYISTRECYLARILEVCSTSINKCLNKKQLFLKSKKGTFILAYYLEDFPSTFKKSIEHRHNSGEFTRKYSRKEVEEIFSSNPNILYKDFNDLYPINKNTFYYFKRNYKKHRNIDGREYY